MKYRVLRLGNYYYAQCRRQWLPFWGVIGPTFKCYWDRTRSDLRRSPEYYGFKPAEKAGDHIKRFIQQEAEQSVEYTIEVEVV